jgi:hypothetical protein
MDWRTHATPARARNPVNLLSRKRDSLRLTTERVGRGHDRLVAQPTGKGYAHTGTVLGRDITSAIQISIEMIPTLPTDEDTLRTAVVAGGMPTPATCLGGMSRVHHDHPTTPFLGLVLDFGFEVRKRPRMHSALGLTAPFGLHSLANVFKVFKHNCCAWFSGCNNLLGEDMIGILPKSRTTTFQLPQMPFGAFGALLLQRSRQSEIAAFNRFPAPLSQEATRRRDRWAIDAHIDADNLIGRMD